MNIPSKQALTEQCTIDHFPIDVGTYLRAPCESHFCQCIGLIRVRSVDARFNMAHIPAVRYGRVPKRSRETCNDDDMAEVARNLTPPPTQRAALGPAPGPSVAPAPELFVVSAPATSVAPALTLSVALAPAPSVASAPALSVAPAPAATVTPAPVAMPVVVLPDPPASPPLGLPMPLPTLQQLEGDEQRHRMAQDLSKLVGYAHDATSSYVAELRENMNGMLVHLRDSDNEGTSYLITIRG